MLFFFCVIFTYIFLLYIYFSSAVNIIEICQKTSYFILPTPVFETLETLVCAQDWFAVITAERELMDLC